MATTIVLWSLLGFGVLGGSLALFKHTKKGVIGDKSPISSPTPSVFSFGQGTGKGYTLGGRHGISQPLSAPISSDEKVRPHSSKFKFFKPIAVDDVKNSSPKKNDKKKILTASGAGFLAGIFSDKKTRNVFLALMLSVFSFFIFRKFRKKRGRK